MPWCFRLADAMLSSLSNHHGGICKSVEIPIAVFLVIPASPCVVHRILSENWFGSSVGSRPGIPHPVGAGDM